MRVVLGARKAAAVRSRGKAGKAISGAAAYKKWGRKYYEKHRNRILKKAAARYAGNKAKYKASRKRWLKKTQGGKRPLYMQGKGSGRKPKFPRWRPVRMKIADARKVGRRPSRGAGRAFKKLGSLERSRDDFRHDRAKKSWRTRKRNDAKRAAAAAKKGKRGKRK